MHTIANLLLSLGRRLLSLNCASAESPVPISSLSSMDSPQERRSSISLKPALTWMSSSLRRKKKSTKNPTEVGQEHTRKTDSSETTGRDILEKEEKEQDEKHSRQEVNSARYQVENQQAVLHHTEDQKVILHQVEDQKVILLQDKKFVLLQAGTCARPRSYTEPSLRNPRYSWRHMT